MYHTRLLMVQITEKNACSFTVIKSAVTFLAIQVACLHLLRNQAWPRGIEILARG